MALSKQVKLRIQGNKLHRKHMWEQSRLYGVTARWFWRTPLTVSYNVQASRKDECEEMFFPVICTPDDDLHHPE